MSIEKLLEELIDAVKDNTAAVKAAGGSAPAKDARDDDRRSSRDSDKGKDDDKGEGRGRGRPSGSKNKDKDDDKGSKKDSKKSATIDDLRKEYGDWLGSEDDKGHDERREFVEAVLNELGVDMMKQVKDDDIDAALYWLDQKKKYPKDNVDFSDRGDGGGDRRGSGGGKSRSLV